MRSEILKAPFQDRKNISEISAYYRKVDIVAAWEAVNRVPYDERLTDWFGNYGMHSPKFEHRGKIERQYEHIIGKDIPH